MFPDACDISVFGEMSIFRVQPHQSHTWNTHIHICTHNHVIIVMGLYHTIGCVLSAHTSLHISYEPFRSNSI